MSLMPFIPLFVAVALGIVTAFAAREKFHPGEHFPVTLRYQRVLRYFIAIGCPLFLALLAFLAFKSRDGRAVLVLFLIGLPMLAGTLWALSFRVIVGEDTIRSGAFFLRMIEYRRIVQAIVYGFPDNGYVKVRDVAGTSIKVWNTVQGFAFLVDFIESKLPQGMAYEFHPEKLAKLLQQQRNERKIRKRLDAYTQSKNRFDAADRNSGRGLD